MIFDDPQVAIGAGLCVIPSLLWSNAQVAFMRGVFGGNEGVRRYLGGFFRLEYRPFKPRLLELYVRRPVSSELRQLQRPVQSTAALTILVAAVGWPLAGVIGAHLTISEPVARSLQILWFAPAIVWAIRQHALPLTERWAPTPYLVGSVVVGILGIAMSLLARFPHT